MTREIEIDSLRETVITRPPPRRGPRCRNRAATWAQTRRWAQGSGDA